MGLHVFHVRDSRGQLHILSFCSAEAEMETEPNQASGIADRVEYIQYDRPLHLDQIQMSRVSKLKPSILRDQTKEIEKVGRDIFTFKFYFQVNLTSLKEPKRFSKALYYTCTYMYNYNNDLKCNGIGTCVLDGSAAIMTYVGSCPLSYFARKMFYALGN
jgi:hypothetical protein